MATSTIKKSVSLVENAVSVYQNQPVTIDFSIGLMVDNKIVGCLVSFTTTATISAWQNILTIGGAHKNINYSFYDTNNLNPFNRGHNSQYDFDYIRPNSALSAGNYTLFIPY